MNDGRALAALALLGIAGAAAVRGSRGVVRAGRSGPGTFTFEPVVPDVRDWGGFCQRCGVTAESYRMSRFNLEYLCDTCLEREQAHPAYRQAQEADQAAVLAKNYHFPGIGLPVDLRQEAEARRGSRGVVRRGRPAASAKVFWKTERIPYSEPGKRWKTAVVGYGFPADQRELNPLPTFTFQIGTGPKAAEGYGGGDPKRLPRRLKRLERWHLTDSNGTPFHYVANAVHFAEIATGRKPKQAYDIHDPLDSFKGMIKWEAVPSMDQGQPWELPVSELTRWLERRLPLLQDVFDADLEEAGIAKPPPRGSPSRARSGERGARSVMHIPGPYARPGALASFAPGSFGIVRKGKSAKQGPIYEVLGKTGDNDPLENGGGVVFKDFDGRTLWWTWSSVKAKRRRYDVYQVDLDPDNLVKQADFFGWTDLADALGASMKEAYAMARTPFAMVRVKIPEAIGTIHGLEHLDEYPQEYTHQELVDRFFR